MTKLCIIGASGRMGKQLIRSAKSFSDVELAGLVERAGSDAIGCDGGELVGESQIGVVVSESLSSALEQAEVAIDFTSSKVSVAHAKACKSAGIPIVIGTTGFSDLQCSELKAYASSIPILWAPNMSPGVNLMFKLVELAVKAVGESSDIEIIEAHHNQKIDSPSGTALEIGRVAAKALNINLDKHAIYGRSGDVGKRPEKEIGFSTIRGGDVVGEHTTALFMDGERLEITHKASHRKVFADGAIKAANWLKSQPPGFYSMYDMLGIS